MTWLIVLAVLLASFSRSLGGQTGDTEAPGSRAPPPLQPIERSDQAEYDGLWKGESPMRFRKNSDPPPKY